MKAYQLMHCILAGMIISLAWTGAAIPQDIDEIIRIAEKGDNMMTSGIGKAVYVQHFPPEELKRMRKAFEDASKSGAGYSMSFNLGGEVEFAFEDSLFMYINRQLKDTFNEEKCAYNGRRMNLLRKMVTPDGDTTFSGDIQYYNPDAESLTRSEDPRYFNSILGEPVAAFLRKGAVFLREEDRNGLVCSVFKGKRDASANELLVWLGPPDMYHRPVSIEYYDPLSKNELEYVISHEMKNGLIIPREIVVSIYDRKEPSKWHLTVERVYTLLDETRYNIDVPDSLFHLSFPENVGSDL